MRKDIINSTFEILERDEDGNIVKFRLPSGRIIDLRLKLKTPVQVISSENMKESTRVKLNLNPEQRVKNQYIEKTSAPINVQGDTGIEGPSIEGEESYVVTPERLTVDVCKFINLRGDTLIMEFSQGLLKREVYENVPNSRVNEVVYLRRDKESYVPRINNRIASVVEESIACIRGSICGSEYIYDETVYGNTVYTDQETISGES